MGSMPERFCLSSALLLITLPVAAHHSFAKYDTDSDITLRGVVTKYEWANPHVYIQIETYGDIDGDIVWMIETHPPSQMSRIGWSATSLTPGDEVLVFAYPPRNANGRMAMGRWVLKEDGTRLGIHEENGAQRLPEDPPTPFVANGLSGRWFTQNSFEAYALFFQPLASWALTDRGVAAVESYAPSMNPANECIPGTAPYEMIFPILTNIQIGDETTTIGYDSEKGRIIHMDLDSHDGAAYTIQGHSIGWWEDDALVIDTTHYAAHRNGLGGGVATGRQRHTVERFELNPDRTGLSYTFWVEDPEYLAEPATGGLELVYRPDLSLAGLPCDPEIARRHIE